MNFLKISRYNNHTLLTKLNYLCDFIKAFMRKIYVELFCSRRPDRDFFCLNPREIFLSHTPVPALGEDKKNEQPHVDP